MPLQNPEVDEYDAPPVSWRPAIIPSDEELADRVKVPDPPKPKAAAKPRDSQEKAIFDRFYTSFRAAHGYPHGGDFQRNRSIIMAAIKDYGFEEIDALVTYIFDKCEGKWKGDAVCVNWFAVNSRWKIDPIRDAMHADVATADPNLAFDSDVFGKASDALSWLE